MDGNERHASGLYGIQVWARLRQAAVSTAVLLLTPLLAAVLLAALLIGVVPQEAAAEGVSDDAAPAGAPSGVLSGAAAWAQLDCSPEVNVTSSADLGPGSLRQALSDVCPGGVIRLDGLAGQTMDLASTLVISQSVTIAGAEQAAVTLSGGGQVRVLEVRGSGLHVTLDNLTVADGFVSDPAICQLVFFQRIFCGAGMLIRPGNFVTVTHSTFRDNRVTEAGRGAGILAMSSQLTLLDDHFENNVAESNLGGAVYIEGGMLRVERSRFVNNRAESGAGIFSGQSGFHIPTISVSDSLFSGNQSAVNGAGISLGNGTLSVRGSTFDANQAPLGAGVYINAGPASPGGEAATVENNTFHANLGLSGVGIQIFHENVILRNNTLVGNQASPERAALEILPGATTSFENNLFSGNSGDCRLMDSGTGRGTLQILAGRNNLFASPGDQACGATDGVDGNQLGGPAYVGALGDYGGVTPTIPLLPGSPALDAGAACTARDQRGESRPLPAGRLCDIGAFESHGFHLTKGMGSWQSTHITTRFTYPLVVDVQAVNPVEPVDGGIVNFSVPVSGASASLNGNPVTIVNGSAAPLATANQVSNSYLAEAYTAGAPERIAFHLTNLYQELIFDLDPEQPDQIPDTKTTTSPCGDTFLGEFGNQTVSLSLTDLQPHAQALITFDLYILRSWDGNQVSNTPELRKLTGGLAPDLIVGPDHWRFDLDGQTLLDTTFSNWKVLNFRQAFPAFTAVGDYPSQTGAVKINSLCYNFSTFPLDAVYHLGYLVDHTAPTMKLDFTAWGLQALEDESWGLADIKVTIANPSFSQTYIPVVVR